MSADYSGKELTAAGREGLMEEIWFLAAWIVSNRVAGC